MSRPAEPNPGEWPFRVGVALIVTSFAIYPLYPLIALLGVPVKTRVAEALVGSVVSWCFFLLGTALAGKNAVGHLKRLLTRRSAPRSK